MILPTPLNHTQSAPPSVMARLADVPRRAYRLDVRHFMAKNVYMLIGGPTMKQP